MALQLLGRAGEAVKIAEHGMRYTRESKRLFTLGFALFFIRGFLGQYRREPEFVRAHCEELITLSEECGFATWLAWGHFFHGWAVSELGQLEGVSEMEMGTASFYRQGGSVHLQYATTLLADMKDAKALLDELSG